MDGTYVVNIDEYKPIGAHWIVLCINDNNVAYFDSFGFEHILKEVKKFIGNKNITIIFRIQAYDLMYGYYCIGFIDFMLKGKSLKDFTNLPFDFLKKK